MSWGFTGNGLPVRDINRQRSLWPQEDTSQTHIPPLKRPSLVSQETLSSLRWLFIDFNSYFASVEQQLNPELRHKPTIVVPMLTDSTCAIAASYEARAYGIKTNTPVWRARQLCPELKIVMAKHESYVRVHHELHAAIESCIPISQTCSIDEFACELMRNEQDPAFARQLALQIKKAIAERVGPYIRCSIGIGPNMWLAKQGTELQKPDGLVLLPAEQLPGPLTRLKLQDLTGIGHNMLRRLQKAGIYSIEDLWRCPAKQLRAIWGSVGGEILWRRLHGYPDPCETAIQNKSMVGHSRVLPPQQRPVDIARLVGRRLLTKAAARLRRYDLTCQHLSLGIRTAYQSSNYCEVSFAVTDDSFTLLQHYEALWQQAVTPFSNPLHIKKINVVLSHLHNKHALTMDLFEPFTAQKRHKILPALDILNQRFGRDTLTIGPLPSDNIETKIAFSRIPELSEFSE